jgi:hypothetical protein
LSRLSEQSAEEERKDAPMMDPRSSLLRQATLAVLCALSATAAQAAQQGTLGATSKGSIAITVSVAPRARISGLKDIDLGLADPVKGARASEDICLLSNSATGAYTIAASGGGPDGAFELADGERALGYAVEWAPRAGEKAGDRPDNGTIETNLRAAASQSDCASGMGVARLAVAIDRAQLAAVQPNGRYAGSLTLIVAPQ